MLHWCSSNFPRRYRARSAMAGLFLLLAAPSCEAAEADQCEWFSGTCKDGAIVSHVDRACLREQPCDELGREYTDATWPKDSRGSLSRLQTVCRSARLWHRRHLRGTGVRQWRRRSALVWAMHLTSMLPFDRRLRLFRERQING